MMDTIGQMLNRRTYKQSWVLDQNRVASLLEALQRRHHHIPALWLLLWSNPSSSQTEHVRLRSKKSSHYFHPSTRPQVVS